MTTAPPSGELRVVMIINPLAPTTVPLSGIFRVIVAPTANALVTPADLRIERFDQMAALYTVLAHAGYFSPDLLPSLRRLGSPLQGHPARFLLPGIEASTGSLGQGLSIALGMALASRLDGGAFRVYAMIGDGESEEGRR